LILFYHILTTIAHTYKTQDKPRFLDQKKTNQAARPAETAIYSDITK
jgi:hypothetical protein